MKNLGISTKILEFVQKILEFLQNPGLSSGCKLNWSVFEKPSLYVERCLLQMMILNLKLAKVAQKSTNVYLLTFLKKKTAKKLMDQNMKL